MNPRRVHELMRQHFPPVDAASREWVNVSGPEGLQESELLRLLDAFIPEEFVLIEVHRKLGDYLSSDEARRFAAAHSGEGEIRIPSMAGYPVINSRSKMPPARMSCAVKHALEQQQVPALHISKTG